MSNLNVALQTSGRAMRVLEKSIGVVQNNTVNASTAGYAREALELTPIPFAPAGGWYGGVAAGRVLSARNDFAEAGVRRELTEMGFHRSRADVLARVEAAFDVTGTASVGGALNELFAAFSSWSEKPNDAFARQNVLLAAGQFAGAMRQTSDDLRQTAAGMEIEISSRVGALNRLAARVAQINESNQQNPDAARSNSAALYAAIEEISEIANVQALPASDGTMTLLLNGQTPLVVGSISYPLTMSLVAGGGNNSLPSVRILDAVGGDVTASVPGGRLGGLLSARNNEIGKLLGDASQNGSLNELAYEVATRVNSILTAGTVDLAGATPGTPLFSVTADASAAANLTVLITDGAMLAAVEQGPPLVANGAARDLARLATEAGTMPGGASFLEYYGAMASEMGYAVNAANDAATRHTLLVSQARNLRREMSGVSLDEEAAKLVELQRSYEAMGQVFATVNRLMDTLLNMVR
jgi:flagellar hook-associated protein 1 FlgK